MYPNHQDQQQQQLYYSTAHSHPQQTYAPLSADGALVAWNHLQPSSVALPNPPIASSPSMQASLSLQRSPSGSIAGSPHSSPKKKQGRPRDAIWDMFDGNNDFVSCRWCRWTSDTPRAFRMRHHITVCPDFPSNLRTEAEQSREDDQAEDSRNLLSAALSPPPSKKAKSSPGTPSESPIEQPSRNVPVGRAPITCHVLDTTSGKPAARVRVRLERLSASGFQPLSNGATDIDGRCESLIPISFHLEAGIFKLTFLTNEYFGERGIRSFYPFIEVAFTVSDVDEHYHIPLLLSPYSYSTYRGS